MFTAPDERVPSLAVSEEEPLATGETTVLPLKRGGAGDAVTDLQLRLVRLGHSIGDDATGTFGPGTERAVRAFQEQRGLRGDGVCGHQTWSAIVEAGFRLGDRLLYRRTPMLHGDDVAELQQRLSELGFDPGGVDGIFGDQTVVALADFQRNVGIAVDGMCGPRTLIELNRLELRPGGTDLVTNVRERLRVSSRPATLQGRRIAVGEEGGFSVGVRATCRALAVVGANAVPLHLPDPSDQAAAANRSDVDCYLGLRLDPTHSSVRTFFYRGYRYESQASRRLAELLQPAVAKALGLADGGSAGMALPILRETRMPAVLLDLGAPNQVVMKTVDLASAIVASLDEWMTLDWGAG